MAASFPFTSSLPVGPGGEQVAPSYRPGLATLLQDLRDARADLAVERRTTSGGTPAAHVAPTAHLLAALEAYVAALEVRRLPVPYALRDELRIRRSAARGR